MELHRFVEDLLTREGLFLFPEMPGKNEITPATRVACSLPASNPLGVWSTFIRHCSCQHILIVAQSPRDNHFPTEILWPSKLNWQVSRAIVLPESGKDKRKISRGEY